MKYNYEFLDEVVEIEVSEEWAAVLIEMDRREYNNNHTETRRHMPLDTVKNNNKAVTYTEPDVADLVILKEELKTVESAIPRLTRTQREIIMAVCYDGMSITEFAKSKGIDQSAASKRMATARKRLKKFL